LHSAGTYKRTIHERQSITFNISLNFSFIIFHSFSTLNPLCFSLFLSLSLSLLHISGAIHPEEDRKRLRHSRDCYEFVITLVNTPRYRYL